MRKSLKELCWSVTVLVARSSFFCHLLVISWSFMRDSSRESIFGCLCHTEMNFSPFSLDFPLLQDNGPNQIVHNFLLCRILSIILKKEVVVHELLEVLFYRYEDSQFILFLWRQLVILLIVSGEMCICCFLGLFRSWFWLCKENPSRSFWLLQAPVSDREYRASLPDTAQMLDLADSLIKVGRGQDLMPREANPDAPISALRYYILLWTYIKQIDLLCLRWTYSDSSC